MKGPAGKFAVFLLLQVLAVSAVQAEAPVLATKLDYTLPGMRDRPIVCKQGDIERFPGKSLADVFGEKWPPQPEPVAEGERIRAQLTTFPRNQSPLKGVPVQRGLVVAAVLVDQSGGPLQVEVLCATTEGFDLAAKRLLSRATYRPAVINGMATTSVATVVVPFNGGKS